MRLSLLVLSSALLATASLTVAAAPLAPAVAQKIMTQRHEGYEQIGKAMRAAKQAIDRGNAAAVKGPANQIAALSRQAPGWFPAGSGPEAGKTHAKAEIWQNRAEFDGLMRNFGTAAAAFQAAAASGDLDRIKDAHGNLGKACGACHTKFREKGD